jgi:capsular exopolysaccharide synthesis family protein
MDAANPPDPFADPFSGGESLKPADFLRMIRERWFVGLFFGLVAAGAFAYFSLQQVPLYRSTASILFERTPDQVVNIQGVVDAQMMHGTEDVIQRHLIQINSGTMLSRVVQSLSPEEQEAVVALYRTEENPNPSVGGIIRGSAKITQGGVVFYLTFQHRDPEVAALLANAYADEYINYMLDRAGQSNESAIRFLRARVEETGDRVRDGELKLQEYREKLNVVSLEENQNIVVQNLNQLNGALSSARIDLLQAETELREVEQALAEGRTPLEIPALTRISNAETYEEQIQQLNVEREVLAVKYLDRHPRMIENAAQIKVQQERLEASVNQAIEALRMNRNQAEATVEQLEIRLAEAEQESLDLDRMAVDFNVLQRNIENDRSSFNQLLNRLNETLVSSQLSTTNVRIVDRAGVPWTPFSPDRTKIFLITAVLFVGLFSGLPIGLGLINDKLKSRHEVESYLKQDLIGEIPRISTITRDKIPLIVLEGTEDLEVEYFNILYSQVELVSKLPRPKVMLVTSSMPEEGKSFVASNLATAYSVHGFKTLLVDCDFRRPSHHRYHGLANDFGVVHWFGREQARNFSEAPSEIPELGLVKLNENLSLLRSGGSNRRPTSMIQDDAFERLIRELKQDFDMVILDSPPGMVFPDALLLAQHADEIVLVCRFNKVSKLKVKVFLDRLRTTETPLLGVVFNGAPSSGTSGTSYYDYKAYKEYEHRT